MTNARACSRCGDMVSPDMKYACPQGRACPIFGRGTASSAPPLGGGSGAPEPVTQRVPVWRLGPRPTSESAWRSGLPEVGLSSPRWFYDTSKVFMDPNAVFVGYFVRESPPEHGHEWFIRQNGPLGATILHRAWNPSRYLWVDPICTEEAGGRDLATPNPSPSLWTPKRPVALGPYWIWDSLHPNEKPFAGWVGKRSLEVGASLTLRTIEGHLLRADDARYWWHPWREEAPEPPLDQMEPPPGTWSHRPWRSGAHRVMNRGTTTRADLIVHEGPVDWREWTVTHGALSLGQTVGPIMDDFGRDALWFAYPDPPAPPDMT